MNEQELMIAQTAADATYGAAPARRGEKSGAGALVWSLNEAVNLGMDIEEMYLYTAAQFLANNNESATEYMASTAMYTFQYVASLAHDAEFMKVLRSEAAHLVWKDSEPHPVAVGDEKRPRWPKLAAVNKAGKARIEHPDNIGGTIEPGDLADWDEIVEEFELFEDGELAVDVLARAEQAQMRVEAKKASLASVQRWVQEHRNSFEAVALESPRKVRYNPETMHAIDPDEIDE